MLKFVRSAVISLLAVLAPASTVLAQLHPMPGSKSETPVLCTGCIGSNASGQPNDGLKTYPYGSPIKDHVGRYVDSSSTASFQHIGFRTARARAIRTVPQQRGSAPPRMYIQIGNAVAAYSLDTFFTSKLPGGMSSVSGIKSLTGSTVGGVGRSPLEKYLPWDGFVYPEAQDSLWHAPLVDGQDRLGDGNAFDTDDRGNLYTAYTSFGWGIVKDDGRTTAKHFQTLVQMYSGGGGGGVTKDDNSGVDPRSIVAIKSGSRYYAVTADQSAKDAVFDVTDPASPRFMYKRDSKPYGIRRWDRDDSEKRIAVVTGDKRLRIYDYADFVGAGNPEPIYEAGGTFADVSFDESGNLWAAEINSKIWKLSPSGAGYSATAYTPHGGKFEHLYLHAAAGHVVVSGLDYVSLGYDVRLLKVESTGLRNIDLDGFFKKFYHTAPQNYAQPAGYTNPTVMGDVQIVKWNGKTYLMYSCVGLGDVFEIEGSDSISIAVTNNNYGTANPNSKGTPGPYVGDLVTFKANPSNPQVTYDVTWDFGNAESDDNTPLKKSNISVTHQYTGLTTTAKITTPKTVRAITVQDSQIATQHLLTLKVPTPRIGISGVTAPITASTTGIEVVAGQTFNDASDGSIEGHYGSWTIDTVNTKIAPNGTIPVGDVGTHTLQFQAVYGKYDTSFNGTSPYQPSPLNVSYTVKPFKATIDAPTTSGTNVKFTGTPLVASAPTVSAPTWTVTWTFNPGGTSTAAVTTQTDTVTINTIPEFLIPKADVVTGSVVTLKTEVDPGGLSTPAQAYPSFTNSMTLSAPDPVITKSGCGNVGSTCTYTVSSPTDPSMTGWTILWTLTGASGTKTSSANPYTPVLSNSGNHTITLKATKSVFEKTATDTFNVQPSLCQPLPETHLIGITRVGCASGCTPGTTVTFWPTFVGYSAQACDSFEWNFGSGQGTATGEEVTHTYTSAGLYTVTLKINNPNGNKTVTTTIDTRGGGGTNPDPTCTTPPTPTISYTGCTAGGCTTNDNITFTAKRGSGPLQTCDAVSWTFESNGVSSSRNPVKKFSSAGTYTVTAVLSNSKGTSSAASTEVTIKTAPPSGGSCSVAPTVANFAIQFSGQTSGCSGPNGQPCQPAETINFSAVDYYYAPAACDKYEWDFGDGTPKVTTRDASHAFANSGNYPVKLRVHNTAGEFTYTKSITVQGSTSGEPTPVLSATTFPSTGVKGRTVTFTATSNMATTTGWTWSFGDNTGNDTSQAGQTKQSSTITHTFTKTGTFTVKATARNSNDVSTAPVGLAQGNITVSDAPAIPEYRFLLPVTAHAGGLGGSKWRTDVQIYVTDPTVGTEANPLQMVAEFKGVPHELPLIKKTHIYEDFLGVLLQFQKDDQGPVIITTKNTTVPPMIWTRTYNQSPNGTFGQFIPAIRIDSNAGGAGSVSEGKYYLSGLRHDDRYRTNVGFLNPNASEVTATVKVYDDDHFAIKQFTRTLQPFQLDQVTLKNIVPELPTDRAFSVEITVPAGKWLVSYASFIDGLSQDPVFLQAIRDTEVASPDFATTVIPGVGHTGAWRSDVTIFNPDSQGLQFDLQYFDAAGTKVAEAPGIRLDPSKFIQYGDILKQGVFGSAPDGLGTLKIINKSLDAASMLQPMAFARTYNDDGANGTFGQGIPAFAAARANVKVNKPALLAGVRNSSGEYYTNIGLVNVGATVVNATVSLLDPVSGASVATVPYTLNPNQTIVGRFNGWGNITSGTFKIEANGDVWAFASIVDERTKDPEYVAATPMQLP